MADMTGQVALVTGGIRGLYMWPATHARLAGTGRRHAPCPFGLINPPTYGRSVASRAVPAPAWSYAADLGREHVVGQQSAQPDERGAIMAVCRGEWYAPS